MVDGARKQKCLGETRCENDALNLYRNELRASESMRTDSLGGRPALHGRAFTGTATGIYASGLPAVLHLPTILAGFLVALLGLIAGALKVRLGKRNHYNRC